MPGMIRDYRGLIAGAIPLLLVIFALAYFNAEQAKGEGRPSTYSSLRKGAKAAFLLLQQSGYPVERWERPVKELPKDGRGILFIVADPATYAEGAEKVVLTGFLRSGGTILAAGFFPDSFVPGAAARPGDMRFGGVECQAVAPTHLTRGGSISLDGPLVWDSTDRSQLLHFADREGNGVVVSYPVGEGNVIWLASAWPLENGGIQQKNNLELVLNLAGGFHRILWDEYHHKEHLHFGSQVAIRGSYAALAQLTFTLAFVLVTYSRRSGPTVPALPTSRLAPLEFVQTLGSVFRRARSTQVAVEIAFQRFRQIATRRLGVRGTAKAREIVEAMQQHRLSLAESTAQLVSTSEMALSDPELTEKSALEYVRALSDAIHVLEGTTRKKGP